VQNANERNFFERIQRILVNIKDKLELENVHDALIVWFAENHLCLDPEDVKERIVRDSHAEGIDAVLLDQTNLRLFLVQAKLVEDFDKTRGSFPENDVKLTLAGARFLLRGD